MSFASELWNLALSLLTLFMAGVAFWLAFYAFRKIRNERDWPTVFGSIEERGVGEPMGAGRNYLPHAKYTYSVDGTHYTNDQVYLIRRTGFLLDVVQRLVDRLPNPVPVHYNPNDPSQSYLLANKMGIVWISLGFGVFALALGLMLLFIEIEKSVI